VGDFPGRQADVDLASARSGAFSCCPWCCAARPASVPSISFRTAEYAAPYTWKPPPGVAVPSTTTVLCCAAASFNPPPLMIAIASYEDRRGDRRARAAFTRVPLHVCRLPFSPRVGSRAALLYHAVRTHLSARGQGAAKIFPALSPRVRRSLDHAGPLRRLLPHEGPQVLRRASGPVARLGRRGYAHLRHGDRNPPASKARSSSR